MNCQEFWETYPELAQPPVSGGHAAECEACARALARQWVLGDSLHAAGGEWRATEAPPRLEQGLRAAFRSQQMRQKRPRAVIWLPVLTWASAAAILILLALLAVRGSKPAAPRPAAPRGVEWASVMPPTAWNTEQDASTNEFIPLPNAEQVGDNEDMNVIRVEVPRSAMLAVGLQVSVDQASEMVEADVMVGPDGLARAVRFVDE